MKAPCLGASRSGSRSDCVIGCGTATLATGLTVGLTPNHMAHPTTLAQTGTPNGVQKECRHGGPTGAANVTLPLLPALETPPCRLGEPAGSTAAPAARWTRSRPQLGLGGAGPTR